MKKNKIANLLPEIFRRTLPRNWEQRQDSVLGAMLAVMETLQEPAENAITYLDHYFDPQLAPDHFLPFLAHWVDLSDLIPEEAPREYSTDTLLLLRRLIAAAVPLARMRGTKVGLERFLEAAIGLPGFTVEDARQRPYHIIVYSPAITHAQERLVRRIVEREKPAYVTYELEQR